VSPEGRACWLKRLLVLLAFAGALVLPAAAKAGPTIVSLTFDDATADQYQVGAMLAQDGVRATFYVNSDNVGASSSFMTWSQLSDLAAGGNEITGHTLDHVDLTTVTTTEATRQVCDDRQAIISHGFSPVMDFAYPYGSENTSIESIVNGCGYSSARRAWGLCPLGQVVPNCPDGAGGQQPYTTPLPPSYNRWRILTVGVHASTTLADLEQGITRAEASGGGWVTLLIHHVCDGCDPTNGASVSASILGPFIDWLAPRSANGTYVRTMQDVVGDHTAPSSSIACNGGSCSSWYPSPVNVTLSATDAGTAVSAIRYTTNGTDPTTSSPLYTGPIPISTTTTVKYRAWDMVGNVEPVRTQLVQVDSTPPSSSIACNGSACASGWYTGSVSVSLSATDTGSGVDSIRYTTDGTDPTIASPLYLTPFAISGTTTVKFRAWDRAGNVEATNSRLVQVDLTPPSSSISCNNANCSSWYGGPVSVSLAATDAGSGVAAIRYTTDGSDPTSSNTLYTGPFNVATTTTVKYRAWDVAGNVEATNSQLIQIDTVPPSSSILCNGSACSTGWYTAGVSVSLSGTDAGSGVVAIRYTTDGSDPTGSSTLYVAPFVVPATATVKYRAWDAVGNVEATNSQLISVDSTPPSSSIGCNGAGCSSGWYTAGVSVSLSATDADSGVAAIRYTTDGSDPTSSSTLYTGPFNVPTTTTIKYRAWDVAGNVEATDAQQIQIDTATPSSSISCNGSACSSGTYGAPVSVSLSATDAGSGVAAIRYTTDGTDPTTASPQYTNPFTVSATTTVKYRAWDVAGNVEPTNTQLIQVDTTPPDQDPPVSSIACNSASCSAGWYQAAVSVSLSATDLGSGVAAIRYTTDGSDPTTASPQYTNPFTVSTTTTVNYRAWDNAGNVEATNSQLIRVDSTPPSSSIACNGATCSSGWYTGPVSVILSAADADSGVAAIRYTTDGSDPTSSSTLYAGPFNVSITTTVKFRAWDVAGNAEAAHTQLIRIDSTPPATSIACNGAACSSGWYTAAVSVSLSATDTGSGVDAIRYTTDGSDPTIASPVYLTPFAVSATTTVKFRAWDLAGNVEATKSQLIRIDTTPPVSSIACNGAACSSGWYAPPVSVSITATDVGSGVAAIRYTLDGSNPSATSTLYTGPFTVSATATVKYRAWDVAGNVEATKTQVIQVDATAPSVAITSPSNGATVTGNVKVIASASDSQSGVASVAFYVDGTLIGTATSSPWQVPWNTKRVPSGQHVLTAIATDRVGNRQTSAPITVTVR